MKLYYNNSTISGKSANYLDFLNKPQINYIDLLANSTAEDVLIIKYLSQNEYDSLSYVNPYTLYVVDDGNISYTCGYLDYLNKPRINNQIIDQNKTSRDLNMYSMYEADIQFSKMRDVWAVTTKPTDPTPDALYYVGPDSEGYYHKWLYDDNCNEINLGSTKGIRYTSANGIILSDSDGAADVNYTNNFICDAFGTLSAITFNDSEAGLVIKPIAGEQEKFLTKNAYEDVDTFIGATTSANGKKGLIPKPVAGDKDKFFCADGTYKEVSAEDFKGATHTAKGKQGYVIKPLTNQHGTWLKGSRIWENPQFLIDLLYPVGTVYASTNDTYPGQGVDGVVASWDRLPDGYALWSASSGLGDTIDAGVPNIKGKMSSVLILPTYHSGSYTCSGAITMTGDNNWTASSQHTGRAATEVDFDAHNSNTIYDDAVTTVQPPAVKTCFYRRVS